MFGLIRRYKARKAAAAFTKAIFDDYFPDMQDIDGSTVFGIGQRTGVLLKTKYDPAVHGDNDYECEPGDEWFVLDPAIR